MADPKAAPSNGPEPQTDKQTVAERQAELSPEGIVQQGNEPNGDSKLDSKGAKASE